MMNIQKEEDSLVLHISASITNNVSSSNGKFYEYKRIVIPNVLMNYFLNNKKDGLRYLYLYFMKDHVYLSHKKYDCKYSKRKVLKFKNKNSFYINLNDKSLNKHNISVGDSVDFMVSSDNFVDDADDIGIELIF